VLGVRFGGSVGAWLPGELDAGDHDVDATVDDPQAELLVG
jgi:hypothetical protein